MDYFVGLDVSVKDTSVCIVDDAGRIRREVKVASEPDALLTVLTNPAYRFKRIGLEAGPLSQWLFSALAEADTAVADSLKALDPTRPIREADISAWPRHVRFAPKSGHWNSTARCPLCAVGSIGRCNTSIKSRSARVSKPKVSRDRSLSCGAAG